MKTALYAALALIILMIVATGAVFWRLSQGPLPLTFLHGTIERAISSQLSGFQISLADAVLEIDGESNIPSVRARNLVLKDLNGVILASAPKAGVALDQAAILRGKVVVRSLELIGPKINARRNLDGSLELGIGEAAAGENEVIELDDAEIAPSDQQPTPATPAAKPAGGRLLEILGQGGGDGTLSRIEDIRITRASLRVFDEANGATWIAPRADLVFRRMPYGFLIVAKAEVASGGEPWKAEISTSFREQTGIYTVNIAVADLIPANVADEIFALSQFARFKMPFSGQIEMELTAGGGIKTAKGELLAAAGEFNLPDYIAKPILVDEGALRIDYEGGEDVIRFNDSSINVGGTRADVSGTVTPRRTPEGKLVELDIELLARKAKVKNPSADSALIAIDRIEFKGAASVEEQRVKIDDLVVMAGETGVRLRGIISGGEESAGIQVAGRLRDVSARLLKELWPPILTPKTRSWIADNVREGRISEGTFQVNFPTNAMAKVLRDRVMADGAVEVAFTMEGVTTSYFKQLPLLTAASGSATLRDGEFNLTIDKGVAALETGEKVKLTKGTFRAGDILQREVQGEFSFDVEGPVDSMLAFAAHPDLNMAPPAGGIAPKLGGTAKAAIGLKMPLIKDVPKARVVLTTKLSIENAKLLAIIPGIDLTDGALKVDVNETDIRVSGPAKLNGVAAKVLWQKPRAGGEATAALQTVVDADMREKMGLRLEDYIKGDVPVTVAMGEMTEKGRRIDVEANLDGVAMKLAAAGWSRKATKGTAATFSILEQGKGSRKIEDVKIDGPGLKLRGTVTMKNNEMVSLRASEIRLEEDDTFTASLTPGDGFMNLDVTGTSLDARPYIKSIVSPAKAPEEGTQPPKGQNFIVTAKFDKVLAHRGEQLRDVSATFVTKRGSITTANIEGKFASGKPLTIRLSPKGDARELRVASIDGGAVLRATDFYGKIAGGQLDFYALMANLPGAPIRNGKLSIDRFEVRDEAALAELDSRGRPKKSGPRKSGISFRKLTMPFTSDGSYIRLCKVILRGPDIGATASGLIRKKDGAIDITGTYIPAYGLNSVVGEIPLLGDILTGGNREGILGLTYAMGGSISKPRYQINPLSFLAPGILRKLFEYEQDACRAASGKAGQKQTNTN